MSEHRPVRTAGRRTKLTDAVTVAVVDALKTGATYQHAAMAAGIGYRTLVRWLRLGRQAGHGPYWQFWQAVRQAVAAAVLWHLRNITEYARDDWRASAWVLEHRHPDAYGNRARIEMEHSGAVTVEQLTEARDAVLEALRDYPAARIAVAARLAELDSRQREQAAGDDGDDDDEASPW